MMSSFKMLHLSGPVQFAAQTDHALVVAALLASFGFDSEPSLQSIVPFVSAGICSMPPPAKRTDLQECRLA